MELTQEQLQNMIKSAVDAAVEPLQKTNTKYSDNLQKGAQADEKEQAERQAEAQAKSAEANAMGEKVEPGIRLARSAKLMVMAKNDIEKASSLAKNFYSEDIHLQKSLSALAASVPGDGGFLIPE